MKKGVKTYQDIDINILKSIPNPTKEAYEIKIKIPECTFLGVREQPDFATIYLAFYPKAKIIELYKISIYVAISFLDKKSYCNIYSLIHNKLSSTNRLSQGRTLK